MDLLTEIKQEHEITREGIRHLHKMLHEQNQLLHRIGRATSAVLNNLQTLSDRAEIKKIADDLKVVADALEMAIADNQPPKM